MPSLVVVSALVTAGWAVTPASPSAYDEEFPQENAWSRATPAVTWCNDLESPVRLEVHIVGRSDVAEVFVTNRDEDDRVQLFDDGSHGDSAPGDMVFTRDGVQPYCSGLGGPGKSVGRWIGFLRVRLKDGTEAGNNYGITVGLVSERYRDVFEAVELGDGLSATAFAFFIHDQQHEVMNDYPVTEVVCGKENFEAYRKLYSVLPDAFDFALVMPGLPIFRPIGLGENVPYLVRVSNAVQHIGVPIMDNSASFGSAGRLKAVIYHSFGSISIVDHEIAHTWGAAIGRGLRLIDESGDHWDELTDIAGQMGAYYFSDGGGVGRFHANDDGTWRLVSNHEVEPYSPLELYTMGLIPPEDVPPVHRLSSPDLSTPAHITAASVRETSMADILAAEGGERVPGVEDSQKAFDLAFIVTRDTPYADADYAYFSLLSYELMSRQAPQPNQSFGPFFWATGGRATLNTRLPVDVAQPQGLPGIGLPSPTSEPTEAAPSPANPLEPAAVPSEPPSSPEASGPIAADGAAKSSPQGFRCALLPAIVIAAGALRGGQQRFKGWTARRSKIRDDMRNPREGTKTTPPSHDR